MPLGDRTGPRGAGKKTGRQAGYCVGYDHPGYLNPNVNRGRDNRGLGVGPLRGGLGQGRSVSRNTNQNISGTYSSQDIWSDGPPD